MIQKLTLFLGYPTYSLTVTLFSLLISSGVGSLLSDRYSSRRNRALSFLVGILANQVGAQVAIGSTAVVLIAFCLFALVSVPRIRRLA